MKFASVFVFLHTNILSCFLIHIQRHTHLVARNSVSEQNFSSNCITQSHSLSLVILLNKCQLLEFYYKISFAAWKLNYECMMKVYFDLCTIFPLITKIVCQKKVYPGGDLISSNVLATRATHRQTFPPRYISSKPNMVK